MGQVMTEDTPKLDPTHVDYWVADAGKLKQAADLCWVAKDNVRENSENARLFGLDKSLIDAADEAESELNWLYPNLIAFAIQHLAVGIMLSRNPRRIIDEGSEFPIIKVIEMCGVHIKTGIKQILSDIENSFRWDKKIPRWSVRLSAEQIQTLKRHKSNVSTVTLEQKHDFDELYNELDKIAAREMALTQATEAWQEAPDKKHKSESSPV
jgi:hypothetical protein